MLPRQSRVNWKELFDHIGRLHGKPDHLIFFRKNVDVISAVRGGRPHEMVFIIILVFNLFLFLVKLTSKGNIFIVNLEW